MAVISVAMLGIVPFAGSNRMSFYAVSSGEVLPIVTSMILAAHSYAALTTVLILGFHSVD